MEEVRVRKISLILFYWIDSLKKTCRVELSKEMLKAKKLEETQKLSQRKWRNNSSTPNVSENTTIVKIFYKSNTLGKVYFKVDSLRKMDHTQTILDQFVYVLSAILPALHLHMMFTYIQELKSIKIN